MVKSLLRALFVFLSAASAAQVPAPPHQAAGYIYAWGDNFAPLDVTTTHDSGHKWYNPGIYFSASAGTITQIDPTAGGVHLQWNAGQLDSNKNVSTDSHISSYDTQSLTGHAWLYGYFEASIKFSTVAGAWPSFYLEAADSKALINSPNGMYPEIDVFEWQSNEPAKLFQSIHVWQSDANGKNGKFIATEQLQPAMPNTNYSQYHTYGLLWTSTSISYYFDNVLVGTRSVLTWPYAKVYTGSPVVPVFINLAVGPGCNFSNTCAHQSPTTDEYVQWVHVFQQPVLSPATLHEARLPSLF